MMSDEKKINITVDLVCHLIEEQFPQWSHLPIKAVKHSGWDNRTFHLGDDMSIRLPSAAEYAGQAEKEQIWLPKFCKKLPLPISAPIAMGKPNFEYPWKWSINHWLVGEAASTASIHDLPEFAYNLALFLKALQSIDAAGGPIAGEHSFYRGGDLVVYDGEIQDALKYLQDQINVKVARKIWETALDSSWQHSAVWVHGDICAGNLLVEGGKLSAVIDFGQLAIGDPACDLAIAWTMFQGKSRDVFKQNLELDAGTWARGRAWALWKAMLYIVNQQTDMNFEARNALRSIHELITDYEDDAAKI